MVSVDGGEGVLRFEEPNKDRGILEVEFGVLVALTTDPLSYSHHWLHHVIMLSRHEAR